MGWPLTEKDLKRYPHFDANIPLTELQRIATSPDVVARNAFFPFLEYEKRWKPFRRAETPGKRKVRPIRYASRRDSAIYSYYRHILSQHYEAELRRRRIESVPIAYRRIPGGTRGKCNIDFAAAAFDNVRSLRNCCAVTLDIKSFFDSIDHMTLYLAWCSLLGVTSLPKDHRRVFRSITQYAVVDREMVYERLGYFGAKTDSSGRSIRGYLRHRRDIPTQLCSPADFRSIICGNDGKHANLARKNAHPYGIPQGAPLSDLLANLYLLEFDQQLHNHIQGLGGSYYRYSDDIFILVPGTESDGRKVADFAAAAIRSCGPMIEISPTKTAIVEFSGTSSADLSARRVDRPSSSGGLEYLGFRFDGRRAYIRESTMSKFHRGIRHAARARAIRLIRRYPGKTFNFLEKEFNIAEFEMRFGRVANFERTLEYRRWTFRTYVKRCSEIFGDQDNGFLRQMRRHRKFIREASIDAIQSAIARRSA